MDRQRHEMILETTHSSGAEEWSCPSCGRRMAITWHPWKKIVLEQGDMYAAHSASKGGLQIGPLQISNVSEDHATTNESLSDDPYLAPWQRWLDQVDSDNLWNDNA